MRILLPKDFGLIAIATVFMNFANLIMDFGFSRALIQRKEVTEKHYATVFFINLIIGIILFILVFLSAPFIGIIYENEVLPLVIQVLSINFILSSFGNIIRAKLYREMNFKIISIVNIIASLLSGALALALAYSDYGVWSLVWQSLTLVFLTNVLLNIFKPSKVKPKFFRAEAKQLWGFSSKLFSSGVIDSIFLNLDQLVIGKVLSPSTLGFYYRAKNLENFAFNYTAGALANVLLPSLSKIQNNEKQLTDAFKKLFHISSTLSFLICGLLFVNAKELIIFLFTDKWSAMVPIFQILIIGAFSKQIFSLVYNVLLSAGMATEYLKVNIINKFLLLLALPIIYFFGIESYLIVFVTIQFSNLFFGIYYVQKKISVSIFFIKNLIIKMLLYFIALTAMHFIHIKDFTEIYLIIINSAIYLGLFVFLFSFLDKSGTKLILRQLKTLKK